MTRYIDVTRYVFILCLYKKIEFYVNLNPCIIDPAIFMLIWKHFLKFGKFGIFENFGDFFFKTQPITRLRFLSFQNKTLIEEFDWFTPGSIRAPRVIIRTVHTKWIKTNLVISNSLDW